MAGEETTNQQSNINTNYNAGQLGLDIDRQLGQKPKGKLSYALNANLENYDFNSISYQNEEGNELVLTFPSGYILIGEHYIQEKYKHIFFLVNPTTGASEIAYMYMNNGTYVKLLNDADLDSPLGFDVQYPIHKIVHRITNCTTEIYWTDGLNERRWLDIDDVANITTLNQLSIQPVFSIPSISLTEILTGGDLKAGTYQFAIQYANADGIGYTSYYSITNPIPIANENAVTVNYDYAVNKSISLTISDIDTGGYFDYYNIAVIKNINNISSVELVGTYEIDKASTNLLYTGQNQTQIRLSIEDIFEKFPYYSVAQDVTAVQDILVWSNLTSDRRISYQSVANQINLKWQTYEIPAGGNYADPANAALLRGYLRDEVYAFEIVFLLKNGKQTDGFHIPGRVSTGTDTATISNNDVIGGGSAPRWQVYNTASVTGAGTGSAINGATVHQYGEFSYWESTETYPSDSAIWGSLAGQPIRHHKFPDNLVSPPFEQKTVPSNIDPNSNPELSFQGNLKLYPLGVRVDIDEIKTLLTNAGLINDVQGFKIVRGNRSTNKSIVAKGILRNVGKYSREGTTYMFPNYPYNCLEDDPFLLPQNNRYIYQSSCRTYKVTANANNTTFTYTSCSTGEEITETIAVSGDFLNVHSLTTPTSETSPAPGIQKDTFTGIPRIEVLSGGSTTFMTSLGALTVNQGTPYVTLVSQTVWYQSGSTDFYLDDAFSFFRNPLSLYPYSDSSFSSPRFTFNSPETSFGSPTLGNIIKLENIIAGAGNGHFVPVEKNAEYKLLTSVIQNQALKSSYDIANATGTFDANAMFTAYQSYLQIYLNEVGRKNYAYSFNSVSSYDYLINVNNSGNKQRELDLYQYAIPGVQSVNDTYDLNNFQRESSVFLKTSETAPFPYPNVALYNETGSYIKDNSKFTLSSGGFLNGSYEDSCGDPGQLKQFNTVTYYGSIKNVFPNQWGQIYTYETIDTGFQVLDLANATGVSTAFGGDTFISKFGFKTKLPFFIDNRVGAPNDSDIEFDVLGNVAYPKYWHSSRSSLIDYVTPGSDVLKNIVSIKSHNFDCEPSPTIDGDTPPTIYNGKMYLFAYGIPFFYCESSINLDLRQAVNSTDGDFYPHVSSGIPDKWFQESNVSIAYDNTYNYNISFSKQNTENYFSHIPQGWDVNDDCFVYYPFRAIYSDPQINNPITTLNNWLIYRPVSYFDFPQNYGNLTSLDGIQNRAILARFENNSLLYNSLLTIDTSNPQAAYVGNDKLFRSAPPISYSETDLGYTGSQHKFLLKIPQGQISIDAKRGQVFLMQGNSAIDLTGFGSGVNQYMKEHLPFEILEHFPTVRTDNAYNGIGLTGVYDHKYDRVIITKLDATPTTSFIGTMTYNETTGQFEVDGNVVDISDGLYFCNKSWTISFSFKTKSWVSLHTYFPSYYIADNNFFYSGLRGGGLWSHLTNPSLFNNYYGQQHAYVIEYPFSYQFNDEILQNVKDYTAAYRYYPTIADEYDYNSKREVNDYFNKAILYNGQQNSGILELVSKPTNNLASYGQYPIYNLQSKTITYTKSDSFYQYNTFWDVYSAKNEPMFQTPCTSEAEDKIINFAAMDYGTRSFRKDPLRAKGLYIRHILDNDSSLHLVSKFVIAPTQISYK